MKLLSLTSPNNSDFRPIYFKNGLNIIVGKKISIEKTDTTNGIGKTFALLLIHYLLGANRVFDECTKENLKKYEFMLELTHNGKEYHIHREIAKASQAKINNEDVDLLRFLDENLLNISEFDKNNFSFRKLFPRFARYEREAYADATKQIKAEQAETNNSANAFLLGLDYIFIYKKNILKNKKDNLKNIQKELKGYENTDNSELLNIQDEIRELRQQLEIFKVADDYYALLKKADELTAVIDKKTNEKFLNEKSIKNKEIELANSNLSEINLEFIERIYNEAEFFFSSDIKHTLQDAKDFHINLMNNRVKRFRSEIELLKAKNNELSMDIKKLDDERSQILSYLNGKGAFEEYDSLKNRLKDLYLKERDLTRLEELKKEFKTEELKLKLEIDTLQAEINNYLNSNSERIKNIQLLFRDITKFLYDKHMGTIDIDILDQKASGVFKIIPKIDSDRSDGINEMKIFAYDMLLYKLNPDLFGFVAHDSRLFDAVDPRQCAKAFEYIVEETKKGELQYFCTLNEKDYAAMLQELNPSVRTEVEKSVIMELTDENPSKKLFGINFNC